jgi:wobble nucleotide-excising tRNase
MIEKIDSIKQVGLFSDYSHSKGREFGDVTILYGENGVGKSTIAAILDSLRERNGAEIVRRRSLPGNVAPTVAVTISGKCYTFDGRDWDDQPAYDTLDVFFPGFVNRNVHAATSVDPEHQRNLCELVLGRKAVEKVTRLADADNEARAALKDIGGIDKELRLLIKKPDTLETFLGLPNDPDINDQLEKTRAELKHAQSRDAILARPVPQSVNIPSIDAKHLEALLQRSEAGISERAALLVREHIKSHLDDCGERWLSYGSQHITDEDKCPFCQQSICGIELTDAIRTYFSEAYRTFVTSLAADIGAVRQSFGTAAFSQLRTGYLNQLTVAMQWKDEHPIDHTGFMTMLSDAEAVWKRAAELLESVVALKSASPLDKIDPTSLGKPLAEFGRVTKVLTALNAILDQIAKIAEARKAVLAIAETTAIETRLHRLENQKIRFEPLAQDLLNKRNTLLQKRTQLDEEKTALKKYIDEHASTVVGKYEASINFYLKHFACDIRIDSIEPRFPSGKASVQYVLKAHGYEIPLNACPDMPSFDTVLSEGDKYTLALSFFFARLKNIEDLTGRVIVLDDPVNSLGCTRRGLIEGVVRELRARHAQIIVLTHDERLAAMMWRDGKLQPIVPLQVERIARGSQMKPWDIESATRTEYVEDYLSLSDYLEKGGDHEKAAVSIRPYVEQRLRHMYPGPPFETRDSLGIMIAKIRKSVPGSRLHPLKEKLPELVAINDAALPSHHAVDDVPGMDPLTPERVRVFAEKALTVLG